MPARQLRRVHELPGDALVLGDQPAREVERAAGHVRVHVHAAGKNHHAGRVDGARLPSASGDDAAVGDADVLDDAVDAVGRIVDSSARYPEHRDPSQCVRAAALRLVPWTLASGVSADPAMNRRRVLESRDDDSGLSATRRSARALAAQGSTAGLGRDRAAMMRLMISSSVGYGDFRAGRSGIGISSMR